MPCQGFQVAWELAIKIGLIFFMPPKQIKDTCCAGELVPGCCPEGVVQFCKEQISSTCNPRLSDTPYRVEFVSNATVGDLTKLKFMVFPVSLGPQLGTPDCSQTDIAQVRLCDSPS